MTPDTDDPEVEARRLLVQLGVAMVATGQPVHEVEEELALVAVRLGYPDAQLAAGPTGMILALGSGQPATFQSVAGSLRLDQAAEVRLIRHQVLTGALGGRAALQRLTSLPGRPARYPGALVAAGWVGASVGIALILQPALASLVVTLVGSALVLALTRLGARSRLLTALLPSVASFLVACLVFGAASAGWLDGPLRTLLPPLAILLPGALLVTGMSELAAGSMVAGVSRVGYGIVQLLLFTLGIVAAAGLFGLRPDDLTNVRADDLGWWSGVVGLLLIGLGITLMESVELRLAPWVTVTVTVAFLAQTAGQLLGGAALGGFLGAVAATLGATVVEAVRPQLARLVVFLPAFWLLVPGSLGLLSVTQLAIEPDTAADTGFAVVVLVCAIALGLLVGAAAARTFRRAARPLVSPG